MEIDSGVGSRKLASELRKGKIRFFAHRTQTEPPAVGPTSSRMTGAMIIGTSEASRWKSVPQGLKAAFLLLGICRG